MSKIFNKCAISDRDEATKECALLQFQKVYYKDALPLRM